MEVKEPYFKIPEKYKEALCKKYSIKHSVISKIRNVRINKNPCPLCKDYKCEDCPASVLYYNDGRIFEKSDCLSLIDKILKNRSFFFELESEGIVWNLKDEQKVRKQFEILKQHVKWVKEG